MQVQPSTIHPKNPHCRIREKEIEIPDEGDWEASRILLLAKAGEWMKAKKTKITARRVIAEVRRIDRFHGIGDEEN